MSDKLVWNVYEYNINTSQIEVFNVFDHIGFYDDLVDLKKKAKGVYDDNFKQKVKGRLMSYFWGRCEYEILISNWIGGEKKERKIDIYNQIEINYDIFYDYLISNIKLLK